MCAYNTFSLSLSLSQSKHPMINFRRRLLNQPQEEQKQRKKKKTNPIVFQKEEEKEGHTEKKTFRVLLRSRV